MLPVAGAQQRMEERMLVGREVEVAGHLVAVRHMGMLQNLRWLIAMRQMAAVHMVVVSDLRVANSPVLDAHSAVRPSGRQKPPDWAPERK